ncbi:hypothetical protein P43SY_003051 [Pythium insidiosum]|uniref:Ankyrin repeat protein n=1 Tax=Pythium insidiosum TaxID=114742 RepID=A0AAD5Q6U3_PYTIN|nr:hypothetical protein P43SY_003051 [Pythium insidiosum]
MEASLRRNRRDVSLQAEVTALYAMGSAIVRGGHVDSVDLLCTAPLARQVMPYCLSRALLPDMLHEAANGGYVEIVEKILACDLLDPDDAVSPFPIAIESEQVEIVRLMLAYGYEIPFDNDWDLPPNLELISILINSLVDVNEGALTKCGTLLHRVIRGRSEVGARLLLSSGADPNVMESKRSALGVAMSRSDRDCVTLLMEYHADMVEGPTSCTVLEWAADELHVDLVEYLVSRGIGILTRSGRPSFALACACAYQYRVRSALQTQKRCAIISLLLRTRTISQQELAAALARAKALGFSEAVELLREYNRDQDVEMQ